MTETARPQRILAEIRVPPEVAPFMDRHGARAVEAITAFLQPCRTTDEKLGALGAFAQVLIAYGDSLEAGWLAKVKGPRA